MKFEWDETKQRQNLRKHGIDFIDAAQAFDGFILEIGLDPAHSHEERWIALGEIQGIVIRIVYTLPRGDVIRLISVRKAKRHEREAFYQRTAF